jgi:hypothetical protein
MKYLIFLFFILISCNNQIKSKNNTESIVSDIFFGKWDLMYIKGIQCNSCPKVEFLGNGKGNLFKVTGETISFNYELSDNRIKFFSIDNKRIDYFSPENNYQYDVFKIENGSLKCNLFSTKGDKLVMFKGTK